MAEETVAPNVAEGIIPRPATNTPPLNNGRRAGTKNTPLPNILTPKVQKAIRLFSTGIGAPAACKESGVGLRYFNRVIKAPIGKRYFEEVSKKIETAFVDKASAVHEANQGKTATQSVIQQEVDESVLESVQELRQILKSSKSDVARANAAKELLDLAQAKKRYMAMQAGDDSAAAVSPEDIALFAKVCSDLKSMTLPGGMLKNQAHEPKAEESEVVRAVDMAVEAVDEVVEVMPGPEDQALPPSGPNDVPNEPLAQGLILDPLVERTEKGDL